MVPPMDQKSDDGRYKPELPRPRLRVAQAMEICGQLRLLPVLPTFCASPALEPPGFKRGGVWAQILWYVPGVVVPGCKHGLPFGHAAERDVFPFVA